MFGSDAGLGGRVALAGVAGLNLPPLVAVGLAEEEFSLAGLCEPLCC